MGGVLKPRVLTLLVPGLMIGFSQFPPIEHQIQLVDDEEIQSTAGDPGVTDLPSWRVGDKWIYSGTFDPSILISDTGVSATVGEIRGDSTAEVIEILPLQFDNRTEWVYKLRMTADFDKSGVACAGQRELIRAPRRTLHFALTQNWVQKNRRLKRAGGPNFRTYWILY